MNGIGTIIRTIGDTVDDLTLSKEEQLRSEIELRKIESNLSLKQMGINLEEAKHKSVFVAGWRPFIGWVCGSALAYHFILRDLIIVIFQLNKDKVPELEIGQLLTVLGGLLGLGTLRTVEKFKGVQSDSIDATPTPKKRGLFRRNRNQ